MRRCYGLDVFTTSTQTRAHKDASEHGYLTTDAHEWPQCGCLSTGKVAPQHVLWRWDIHPIDEASR